MNNLTNKSLLAAMIVDAKNYLANYIAENGHSSVTVNAQKRIDAMLVRYNNEK